LRPATIEVDKLKNAFGGAVAVRSVSFRVAAGERPVRVGGSRRGRTTTLKMINPLIEPDPGTLLIDGATAAAIRVTCYNGPDM